MSIQNAVKNLVRAVGNHVNRQSADNLAAKAAKQATMAGDQLVIGYRPRPITTKAGTFPRAVTLKDLDLERAAMKQPGIGAYAPESLKGATLVPGAKLQGQDLSGFNLEGARLAGVDLRGADLSFIRAKGAVLDGSDLSGATATNAWLNGASLVDTRLPRVDQAFLEGAEIRNSAGEIVRIKHNPGQGDRWQAERAYHQRYGEVLRNEGHVVHGN
jgi:uncharacterized protein YjbI with pentapeptide repeats